MNEKAPTVSTLNTAQKGKSLIKGHIDIQMAKGREIILLITPFRDSDKTSSRFTSPECVLSSNQPVKQQRK